VIRIEQIGVRPRELAGWSFAWVDDPAQQRRVLMCGPFEVGGLSHRILAAAGPDSPLTVTIDWPAITAALRGEG
jgi:hypothetical protein